MNSKDEKTILEAIDIIEKNHTRYGLKLDDSDNYYQIGDLLPSIKQLKELLQLRIKIRKDEEAKKKAAIPTPINFSSAITYPINSLAATPIFKIWIKKLGFSSVLISLSQTCLFQTIASSPLRFTDDELVNVFGVAGNGLKRILRKLSAYKFISTIKDKRTNMTTVVVHIDMNMTYQGEYINIPVRILNSTHFSPEFKMVYSLFFQYPYSKYKILEIIHNYGIKCELNVLDEIIHKLEKYGLLSYFPRTNSYTTYYPNIEHINKVLAQERKEHQYANRPQRRSNS